MALIDLQIVPHRAALLAGHDNTLDVLVRAGAPESPANKNTRAPMNLALVLDRSGSMSGHPLEEAKRCASMMIDSLTPADRASIVVYDNNVDVLVPSQPVVDRSVFHRALMSVVSGGMTALYDGWLRGANQAATGATGPVVSRVLLLSDGQANEGRRRAADITPNCTELADAQVTTSTYGLGQDFNEELMTAMATAGRGNAYYGQSAEDLMDSFRQEFDLMSSLCARNLKLTVSLSENIGVEVVNGYKRDVDGCVLMPDLAYGGEAWALLRLTVPQSVLEASTGNDTHLLTVTLEYKTMDDRSEIAVPAHIRLPRLPAEAYAAVAPDTLVARRAAELRAAGQQERAREAARNGDWEVVQSILDELRLESKDNPWLLATVEELEKYAKRRETENFSKEAMYKSRAMRSRLAAREESSEWSASLEQAKPMFLRRKTEQGRRFEKPDDEPGAPRTNP
jgi:Ca-activated chloride channel family protein